MSETASISPLVADLDGIASDICARWDRDMRSGKLLAALEGRVSNYDLRVTRIREALAAHAGLVAFARAMIAYPFEGLGADGGDIQSLALTHGLIAETAYDPKEHGASADAEPGDTYYVLAGPLATESA